MEELIIEGGVPLSGSIEISGSKNGCLAVLAACLLFEEEVTIMNIPQIKDVKFMLELLSNLGARVSNIVENNCIGVKIDCSDVNIVNAEYDIVRKMRASSLVLGPLLSRFGEAVVSLPGGCAIGVRPINWHIDVVKSLGAEVVLQDGCVHAKAPSGLIGGEVSLPFPSVGATENAICAAINAKGQTVIKNAATEPDVIELCKFLNSAGADIKGVGTSTIEIVGEKKLKSTNYRIDSDRIEAFTYAIAIAATKGRAMLKNASTSLLSAFLPIIKSAGVILEDTQDGSLLVSSEETFRPCDFHTAPYPGFPTDGQAQMMSLLCIANGTSRVTENIFESRFMHVAELIRLGANISVSGNTATVIGVDKLYGASVMATDLRASASLLIAALMANGVTTIKRVYHLDRGYENIDGKLEACGAKIKRNFNG